MLHHLFIRNFAIVDQLELEFAAGMSVLTGETGAGKSILLDALGLCLGDRADSALVRHGQERAEVSASFSLKGYPAAQMWLREHELDTDDECVIRRTVGMDGRSKAFINGQPVPLQSLKELGEQLVDIHGQHAHQSLLRREVQRQLLDDFAGHGGLLDEVGEAYRRWQALQDEYDTLRRAHEERDARQDLLRYQVSELEALGLAPGELERVEEEHTRLAHATRLLEGAQLAEQLLYESDEAAAVTLLSRAFAELQEVGEYDTALIAPLQMVESALIQAREAASELRHYRERLDLDPERLANLEQRLAAIHALSRKHRVDPAKLPALLETFQEELTGLEGAGERLGSLEDSIIQTRRHYFELAQRLGASRRKAAGRLSEQVSTNMHELGIGHGLFKVELEPLSESQATVHGLERIEFLVTANPGQPPRPLAKVASGGELSRISLSIQVITASLAGIPTLIFDEVDVGVGGRVAEMVGRRLRALGKSRQVFCVTHQPQVAALGHHHYQVRKEVADNATLTRIRPLSAPERVDELARMLGGLEITAQTESHARELLERAGLD